MKYLGRLLDSKWSFGHHFDVFAFRVERVSTALGRLLSNLKGPDGQVRRLHVATVNAVALYGCPIWAADLAAMRRAKDKLRRVQRYMSARVIRAYRTVSYTAVTVLAGWPLLEYLAAMYSEMYWQERELRGRTRVRKLPARPKGHPEPRPAVHGGEVRRPPLRPKHSGSEDRRGCPALSRNG